MCRAAYAVVIFRWLLPGFTMGLFQRPNIHSYLLKESGEWTSDRAPLFYCDGLNP